MWRSAPPCIFDPNLHKECKELRICSLVWNRTLFWRAAALNIFIQVQCQILHYIRRKRQLLGWLSCGSVNAGFESEISDQVASLTLTFLPLCSEHQQLLHTEAQLDTTPWYSSQTQRLNVHLWCMYLILLI